MTCDTTKEILWKCTSVATSPFLLWTPVPAWNHWLTHAQMLPSYSTAIPINHWLKHNNMDCDFGQITLRSFPPFESPIWAVYFKSNFIYIYILIGNFQFFVQFESGFLFAPLRLAAAELSSGSRGTLFCSSLKGSCAGPWKIRIQPVSNSNQV